MMRKKNRSARFAVLYAILLLAFTVYAALDTFVIARAYAVEEISGAPAAASGGAASGSSAGSVTGGAEQSGQTGGNILSDSYSDGNISVSISEFEAYDTRIYVADVRLSSPEYLKTALAHGVYGRNIKAATSAIAAENSAILAVNGDFYGSRQSGYVIRNGTLYRDEAKSGQEDLVIYSDGSFEVIREDTVTASELIGKGAVQTLSFGPALIANGMISVTASDEVGKAKASNPRTAIGVIDDLHYVFVVSDGRTSESSGLSLYQLAQVMQQLGVKTAYNLDGGGSSTMVFMGEVINNPASGGETGERSVSDIVYIGY